MAKSKNIEQAQALLAELREATSTTDALQQWRLVFQCKDASTVAQAAKIVGKRGISELTTELVDTFDRLMKTPVKSDPNCLAKAAIADALYRLESADETLFLRGIRHVQMEPVWGGTVDTAATLRGSCALGLVRMHYPGVMTELADLLADPEAPARMVAARAIAYSENSQGIPLLRLRAQLGDEPQVLSEYLDALLKLAPEQSLEFVAGFLSDANLQVQELVALVLGESRQPQVLEILKTWLQRVRESELRSSGLLAIAMLRTEDAFEFLLDLLAKGNEGTAQEVMKALEIYRQDHELWKRVCEASGSK